MKIVDLIIPGLPATCDSSVRSNKVSPDPHPPSTHPAPPPRSLHERKTNKICRFTSSFYLDLKSRIYYNITKIIEK